MRLRRHFQDGYSRQRSWRGEWLLAWSKFNRRRHPRPSWVKSALDTRDPWRLDPLRLASLAGKEVALGATVKRGVDPVGTKRTAALIGRNRLRITLVGGVWLGITTGYTKVLLAGEEIIEPGNPSEAMGVLSRVCGPRM